MSVALVGRLVGWAGRPAGRQVDLARRRQAVSHLLQARRARRLSWPAANSMLSSSEPAADPKSDLRARANLCRQPAGANMADFVIKIMMLLNDDEPEIEEGGKRDCVVFALSFDSARRWLDRSLARLLRLLADHSWSLSLRLRSSWQGLQLPEACLNL